MSRGNSVLADPPQGVWVPSRRRAQREVAIFALGSVGFGSAACIAALGGQIALAAVLGVCTVLLAWWFSRGCIAYPALTEVAADESGITLMGDGPVREFAWTQIEAMQSVNTGKYTPFQTLLLFTPQRQDVNLGGYSFRQMDEIAAIISEKSHLERDSQQQDNPGYRYMPYHRTPDGGDPVDREH